MISIFSVCFPSEFCLLHCSKLNEKRFLFVTGLNSSVSASSVFIATNSYVIQTQPLPGYCLAALNVSRKTVASKVVKWKILPRVGQTEKLSKKVLSMRTNGNKSEPFEQISRYYNRWTPGWFHPYGEAWWGQHHAQVVSQHQGTGDRRKPSPESRTWQDKYLSEFLQDQFVLKSVLTVCKD